MVNSIQKEMNLIVYQVVSMLNVSIEVVVDRMLYGEFQFLCNYYLNYWYLLGFNFSLFCGCFIIYE